MFLARLARRRVNLRRRWWDGRSWRRGSRGNISGRLDEGLFLPSFPSFPRFSISHAFLYPTVLFTFWIPVRVGERGLLGEAVLRANFAMPEIMMQEGLWS